MLSDSRSVLNNHKGTIWEQIEYAVSSTCSPPCLAQLSGPIRSIYRGNCQHHPSYSTDGCPSSCERPWYAMDRISNSCHLFSWVYIPSFLVQNLDHLHVKFVAEIQPIHEAVPLVAALQPPYECWWYWRWEHWHLLHPLRRSTRGFAKLSKIWDPWILLLDYRFLLRVDYCLTTTI